MSRISKLHYFKLIFRSCLFLAATISYIINRQQNSDKVFSGFEDKPLFLLFICIIFAIEITLRFFPSDLESMGCQKQFERNYEPIKESATAVNQSWKTTMLVAVIWLVLNLAIGALYFLGAFDRGILILIAIAYSVCDIICILFFCPFQTWFMKNRCCTTCRIYNWDFAMMFTPLVFIPSIYTYSLLGFALVLLLRWEVAYRLHPERFSEATNKCLDCSVCREKLCSHKKQLQGFLKKYKTRFFPARTSNKQK